MELKPHLLEIVTRRSAQCDLSPQKYLELLIMKDDREKHTKIYVKAPYDDNGKWLQFTVWADSIPWKDLLYLEPLTRDQFYDLYNNWGFKKLCDILIKMDNHRPVIKRRSIHKTAANWLRRTRKAGVHE